jgi:hypothetical protein
VTVTAVAPRRGVAATLYDALSDICSAAWSARWVDGAEYEAWRLVVAQDLGVDRTWGRYSPRSTPAPLLLASLLARQADCWIGVQDGRVVEVPMDEWLRRYRAWTWARTTTQEGPR